MLYQKSIPPFFAYLLGKLNKFSIYTIDGFPEPHENIHYQPSKDGVKIFTSHIIKLSHEMAHMLETKDDNKLTQNDYGIKKYFPMTVAGKLQALARESRTRGIQTRLVEVAFGSGRLLSFNKLPLDVAGGLGKLKTTEEALSWSRTICQSAYDSWDRDRIISAWEEKSHFLNNFFETKGV